jgi:amino acid permease
MLSAAYLGTSFSLAMYLTMGFLGYLIYGDEIKPNYLETVEIGNVGKFVFVVL